ncbi:DUF3450 family protein [Salidesulfovibrio onnuriiensis]|uniref:DUF3450 family protein n=1 Tax=Salidesulfovibrio onnuriiensis TaxID=2583823 RepID=UPI0011CA5A95|nr:DUF3450 family protein [Salidesulfovibrio onnuriiensis]
MRFLCAIITLLLLSLPAAAAEEQQAAPSPQESTWNTTVGEVEKLRDHTKAEAATTLRNITQERQEMERELKALRAEKQSRSNNYESLLKRFEELTQEKQALDTELDSQQDSMRLIEGAVRTSAKQLRKRALNSPATAEHPGRLGELDRLLDADRFPGLESIQVLTGIWFREMAASGEVRTGKNLCVAPDGGSREGTVTRMGTLGAFFTDNDGHTAFLRSSAEGRLEIVSGDFAGAVDAAESFATGKVGAAPLDFSGGEVFKRFGDESSFMVSILSGGALVWPILLVGLIGFALASERFFTLSRIRTCPDCKMGTALEWALKGDLKRCASCLGDKGNTPTCRVLKHVILHSGGTLVSMEKGLQESILQEVPKLERFLPTINILAAVAPLLGLLGTVTGMIGTFQVITIFGTGDARMMSGGISEALITTQLGLAVAVPLTLMHHFLERKVDRMVSDMEEKGTTLVARIIASEKGE